MITEARVDELFEYVDKELRKIQRSRKLPGGAVLVGGTAKLPGMADFVRERLQLPARLGRLQPLAGLIDTVEDSAYCTAVGLMLLDILLPPDNMQLEGTHQGVTGNMLGVVDNVLGYFKHR
jgi:cell division protein FtsA